MTPGEFDFVMLVVGAMVVFAAVIAYGSWVAPGRPNTEDGKSSK